MPFHKALSDGGAAASVPMAPSLHTTAAAQNKTAARMTLVPSVLRVPTCHLLPPSPAAEPQLSVKTEDLSLNSL